MTRAVAVLRAVVFATATLAAGAAFAASTDVTEAPAAPATQVAQAEKPAAEEAAPVKHKAKKPKAEEKAEAKPEAAAAPAPAAAAPAAPAAPVVTAPPAKASRELLRRVLLDACVYQENAKEDAAAEEKAEKVEKAEKPEVKANKLSAKQQKILDACQCASTKAIKPIKDEDIVKIDENRQVPDAWYQATTEAYATCKR
jgi:hypothetical protein